MLSGSLVQDFGYGLLECGRDFGASTLNRVQPLGLGIDLALQLKRLPFEIGNSDTPRIGLGAEIHQFGANPRRFLPSRQEPGLFYQITPGAHGVSGVVTEM
jgi:hypothetical protein